MKINDIESFSSLAPPCPTQCFNEKCCIFTRENDAQRSKTLNGVRGRGVCTRCERQSDLYKLCLASNFKLNYDEIHHDFSDERHFQ